MTDITVEAAERGARDRQRADRSPDRDGGRGRRFGQADLWRDGPPDGVLRKARFDPIKSVLDRRIAPRIEGRPSPFKPMTSLLALLMAILFVSGLVPGLLPG